MSEAAHRQSTLPVLRAVAAHLPHLPLRFWLLLCGAHLVLAGAVPLVVALLFRLALDAAGLPALTDRNALVLLGNPRAGGLLALAAALVVTGTLAWLTVTLAVAEHRMAAGASSARAVLRRAWSASGRSVRSPRAWLTVLALAVAGPLAGIPLFAPASSGLAIPPFIPREFLKVDVTAVIWALILAALALGALWALLAAPSTLIGVRSAPAGIGGSGPRATLLAPAGVLLVGSAALLLAQLIGADSAAPSAASVAEQVVTVVAAQAVAIAVVARTRLLAGLSSAAGARTGPFAGTHSARAGLAATVLAGSAAALIAGDLPPWIVESAAARQQDRPLVIAHRGYDAGGPENTIAGLEAAARFSPDYVEVDVQQTADGDYVASHDVNLTILAGKNEAIYEMSTGQVTRTTVTMHGHSDTIPTMTEYVRRADELGIPLLIELKVTGHEKREPVAELLAQLDASGTTANHAFHSLDLGAVQELKRQRPQLRVGLTLGLNLGQLPRTECDFYVVEQASITPGMIDEAHRQGRDLYAWTVNEGPAMQALLDIGVDGLVTDRPDDASRVTAAVAVEEDPAGRALGPSSSRSR